MSPQQYAAFATTELPVALSHYDLGVIESITEMNRGSHQSPKVGIVAARGKFVLKRLEARRTDPDRLRFAHRVQAALESHGFPVARLVPTQDDHLALQTRQHTYELYEFVRGQPYRGTVAETHSAGVMLARLHDLTGDLTPTAGASEPHGDYHDHPAVRQGLCSIEDSISSHDSLMGNEIALVQLTAYLLGAYDRAAAAVNASGYRGDRVRVVHGDWHPGNMLFRNDEVVGVVDFDAVRWSTHVIDIANGALQCSLIGGGDVSTWPDHPDLDRFQAFLDGYGTVRAILDIDRKAIPELMIEALIAECVPPIAQTGLVGRWSGFRVLQTVKRKVVWLEENGATLRLDAPPRPGANSWRK